MGITIILEDEKGDALETLLDNAVVSKILPDMNNKNSYCLRFVDLYGDTTFNNLQMTELIIELGIILKNADTKEKVEIVNDLLRLAKKCKEESHLYLKFYGD